MSHQWSILLMILIVAFALYRRVRRNIGWQKYSSKQIKFRAVLFIVIALFVLASSFSFPLVYISDAVGIGIGLVLAYFAIKTTQFQEREGKWLYRPNAWIGTILLALVFGRIIYRVFSNIDVYKSLAGSGSNPPDPNQMSTYISHPYTAGIIFILIAYYISYYLFLMQKKESDFISTTPNEKIIEQK